LAQLFIIIFFKFSIIVTALKITVKRSPVIRKTGSDWLNLHIRHVLKKNIFFFFFSSDNVPVFHQDCTNNLHKCWWSGKIFFSY
jgi:hypothetical protein